MYPLLNWKLDFYGGRDLPKCPISEAAPCFHDQVVVDTTLFIFSLTKAINKFSFKLEDILYFVFMFRHDQIWG